MIQNTVAASDSEFATIYSKHRADKQTMTTVCDVSVYEQGVWLLRASAVLLVAAIIGRGNVQKDTTKEIEMIVPAQRIQEAQAEIISAPGTTAPPAAPPVPAAVMQHGKNVLTRRKPAVQQQQQQQSGIQRSSAQIMLRQRGNMPRMGAILHAGTSVVRQQPQLTPPQQNQRQPGKVNTRSVGAGTTLKLPQSKLKTMKFDL